jgi:hypothetical protein
MTISLFNIRLNCLTSGPYFTRGTRFIRICSETIVKIGLAASEPREGGDSVGWQAGANIIVP